MLNRRDLLTAIAAGGTVLALPRLGWADETAAAAPARTVVLLHLNGGNDGLNTVVPYKQRRYFSLRPSVGVDRGAIRKVSDDLGFHPALNGFEQLFRRDRLAVVNGVGYPNPNYSHFRATEIWQTGEPEKNPTFGWVGRALEARASKAPLRAVALEKQQPLAFVSAVPGVVTMTDFGRFRVPAGLDDVADLYGTYGALGGRRGEVGRAGEEAIRVAKRISKLKPAHGPMYQRLGEDLKKVIPLLEADLGLECIHLSQGGYDTHSGQATTHQRLLSVLGNNLNAFQGELDKRGLADRVVTIVYSEFGRRATENLSGGTDHGSAGPVFVIGKGVNAGFHGAYPSLDDLDDENLKFTTDFRRVYATLLRDALRMPSKPVLGDHAPLELFA